MLSKLIGIVIIIVSVFAKVPQITKIHKAKSGAGINLKSVTLELAGLTIFMSYSFIQDFPFSSWGDCVFLSAQTLTIAALVLAYDDKPGLATAYVMIYSAVCFVLMGGYTRPDLLWTLQSTNIPICLAGKLLQVYTNYQNGNTGQLSPITTGLLFLGSVGRIYTSIEETGDFLIILTNVVITCANSLLIGQIIYYWSKARDKDQ